MMSNSHDMSVDDRRSHPLVTLLKVLAACSVALGVTMTLFLFMQHLINVESDALDRVELAGVVELYQTPPQPDEVEPESPPEPEVTTADEPQMDTSIETVAEQPIAAVDQAMPSVDMGSMAINVGSSVGQLAVPVSGQTVEALALGGDNKGYVEVVPYATRQPDIPLLAWQNKINGWVLVVFSITSSGYTKNIRVLDANPRGIFEEEVLKAVAGWRYDVRSISNYSSDMLVTQKVELYWKNYPDNMKR